MKTSMFTEPNSLAQEDTLEAIDAFDQCSKVAEHTVEWAEDACMKSRQAWAFFVSAFPLPSDEARFTGERLKTIMTLVLEIYSEIEPENARIKHFADNLKRRNTALGYFLEGDFLRFRNFLLAEIEKASASV